MVDYHPTALIDDQPVMGAKVTNYQAMGMIFNQDMAVIEGVDHWVPASDLEHSDGIDPQVRADCMAELLERLGRGESQDDIFTEWKQTPEDES